LYILYIFSEKTSAYVDQMLYNHAAEISACDCPFRRPSPSIDSPLPVPLPVAFPAPIPLPIPTRITPLRSWFSPHLLYRLSRLICMLSGAPPNSAHSGGSKVPMMLQCISASGAELVVPLPLPSTSWLCHRLIDMAETKINKLPVLERRLHNYGHGMDFR